MRTLFLIMLFMSASFLVHSQIIGIGFGSGGINVKSNPISQVKLIGRIDPLYSSIPANSWVINGNFMAGYNLLSEGSGDLYTGMGIGTASTESSAVFGEKRWFLNLPTGFELHPFSNKKFSLAAEMGPRLVLEKYSNTRRFYLSSLLEFSYYL